MTKSMHISLKAGEKLFLNGAVLQVDRKVTLELLNDATFLLESHVMQPEDTTTPLRQLYFVAQSLLVDPANADAARGLFFRQLASLVTTFTKPAILMNLDDAGRLVGEGRTFEALKALRGTFPLEEAILNCAVPPKVA
ncbi:flagellar biosynthesis repressor FlbT [Xanthobacter sp. 126]|uniref:flagellar biosynthesis repressor FlbT n=1 Tax=Xanthobacter sp. 126 TaxID=1131814 RepID=UPI00045E8550|nr:flagellar biosynthesis repressor FlbT [Xanthobacter sp. 126]